MGKKWTAAQRANLSRVMREKHGKKTKVTTVSATSVPRPAAKVKIKTAKNGVEAEQVLALIRQVLDLYRPK
jgi:hypothetical protein